MSDILTSSMLLNGASADGTPINCQLAGRYCFSVAGTFGGATVGLRMLGPDGTTWIAIEDDAGAIAITAAKAIAVLLPAGSFKATVTGGSGASLYAKLDRMAE